MEVNDLSENYQTGFIALYRSLKKHWIWDDDKKLKWWLDILLTVNHKDMKILIGGTLIECKRGQSIQSLQTWAKSWRTTKSTVRNFFKLLQSDNMIKTEKLKNTTRLTVCNYDSYNKVRHAGGTPSAHSLHAGGTPSAHPLYPNNNVNNDNNVNNENNDNKAEAELNKFSHMCMNDTIHFVAPLTQQLSHLGFETELLPEYFDDFNRNLMIEGDTYKSYQDYRKHFKNWMGKRLQSSHSMPTTKNTDPNGKPIDRRLHPNFPSDYVYCDMNIYYYKNNKPDSMRKDGNFSDLQGSHK